MTTITTVGIFLTEDERRHLTRLCNELDVMEERALRSNEGPEAQTRAAEQAALRKLMGLPAVSGDIRGAFESGFAIGVERAHDTAQVRAEVTEEMIREDLAVCDRAFDEHMAGIAETIEELQCFRAMERRLREWADQLEANRDKPGDVGKFIAAELRNRIAGTP